MAEEARRSRRLTQLAAGEALFRDGDPGDAMYVVQSGRMRVFSEVGGREQTLATMGPGEFFGEMALLTGKPRNVTAVAVEPSQVVVIDGKTFGAMVTKNAEIAVRLIRRLAARLEAATAQIDVLIDRHPAARVALELARHAEFEGEADESGAILVDAEPNELAEQAGVSDQEALRTLRRLYRLGLADPVDGGFAVTNPLKLRDFADFARERDPAPSGAS